MNSLLARLHRVLSTQACLANSASILSLYLCHLSSQVQKCAKSKVQK